MRIKEAAARTGVSADTLRYYERQGLLPRSARTVAGYRDYTEASLERIRFVKNALRIGFSVKQVASFLRARDEGRPPCREVRAAGDRILADVDRRIVELSEARAELARTLEDWDRRLATAPAGQPARLLEAIPPSAPGRATSASRSTLKRRP